MTNHEHPDEPRNWVIRKNGYYYRADRAGYTASLAEAGRYTEAEAKKEAAVEPWHMSALRASDISERPEYPDNLSARLAALEAELEALHEGTTAIYLAGYREGKKATLTAARIPGGGAAAIAAERQRQVEQEGWTPEHDDKYVDRQLAKAAGCYTWLAAQREGMRLSFRDPPPLWPDEWSAKWWKPKDPRSDLVRAGALIAAEIDRLDRAIAKCK